MKLYKIFKGKKSFKFKKKSYWKETNQDEMTAQDKLFYIMNIGNYEFNKNKKYFIDEIEYRLDNGDTVKSITNFLYTYTINRYNIMLKKHKLTNWIKKTYKQKLKKRKTITPTA